MREGGGVFRVWPTPAFHGAPHGAGRLVVPPVTKIDPPVDRSPRTLRGAPGQGVAGNACDDAGSMDPRRHDTWSRKRGGSALGPIWEAFGMGRMREIWMVDVEGEDVASGRLEEGATVCNVRRSAWTYVMAGVLSLAATVGVRGAIRRLLMK